jgi:hypothetical protein
MKAKNFDKKFDDGAEDILQHFDVKKAADLILKKKGLMLIFLLG